jgi:Tol biopolymer transport system component
MELPRRKKTGLGMLLLVALAATVSLPEALTAQYFGRNQVQYRTFDFRVMQTEHFDVYYYPEAEEAARDAARMAERWYTRLSRILDHRFRERQPLILYATHPHFQQTNILGGMVGEGTGGAAEVFKQRIVMPFAHSYADTDHVLGHEIVHAFQYDISGLGRAGGGIEAAARRFQVPLWFIEGMAEYLATGPVDPHTAMWVRDGALRGDLPSIERMTYDPSVFPYRWGQALWAYVGGRWGDAAIGEILKLSGQGVPYPAAFQRILNISIDELSADWHASIRRAYLPMLADRAEAREIARPLITRDREGGRLNVAPAVSPDGQRLVFLSELDFMDVEMHLADARTGEVVRRLQRGTAFDPHFGSLRYISSAGTWSPDSRQFAFSALRQGRDVIVIMDVEPARRIAEIRPPGIDEISNPAWSPDGQSIAFSGLVGGLSNLYVVDVETHEVRQLTDDRHTMLHPAYSPDGSRIAFATDMGPDTDFDRLTYGGIRLAVMDLESGRIDLVPGVGGRRSINPQWTADGNGLFFISNRTGIPNIYRVDIATGELARITDLFTGVSGITNVSPALSVARDESRLLFTAYEANGWNIYALTDARELAGEPVSEEELAALDVETPLAAILPPLPRPQEAAFNRITQMVGDPDTGLPSVRDGRDFAIVNYRPRLGLDYLGQPQVGVSVGGAFGSSGLYGGIFGIFSDMLARHTVFAAIQAQGQFDEIGGALQYINQRERWNFGGVAQRVPMVFGYYREGFDAEEDLFVQQLVRVRFFDSSLQGFAQYPFSMQRRVEFSGGLRRVATDQQVWEFAYDRGGRPVGERQRQLDGIGYNFFETSAAMVYDNSLLGWTSPFAGQRYRFQISPTFGQLQFTQALADYRRYFFASPFTLAVRGLHLGRYGRDAEVTTEGQQLFNDLYLGQPWYVRGYLGTWNSCLSRPGSHDCQVVDQLFGSRVGVASAELRFPLIRQLVVGTAIPFPPIEGIAFADAGIAWTQDSAPRFVQGLPADPTAERGIMTSAGVGARINLLGMLVMEIDYVNAFARERGWHWQFGFVPGF